MPFGLTNALAICIRIINTILRLFLDITVICYLDDILVYSKTLAKHINDIKVMLITLRDANLVCKPEKCEFHVEKINFFSYKVLVENLSINFTKVSIILNWREPTTIKNV